ncbi:hypothetical protein D9M71_488910 [compost metagenome]
MHDPVALFRRSHQFPKVFGLDQQLAVFLAVLVGRKHRGSLPGILQHTVNEDLDPRKAQVGHALKLVHHAGQYLKVRRPALGVGNHQGGNMRAKLALFGQRAIKRQHAVALLGGFEIKQRIVTASVGGGVHPGGHTVLIVDPHRFTGGLEHNLFTGSGNLATHLVPLRFGKIAVRREVSLVTDIAAVLF